MEDEKGYPVGAELTATERAKLDAYSEANGRMAVSAVIRKGLQAIGAI